MKRSILFTFSLFILITAFPQKETGLGIIPPAVVTSTFKKDFPDCEKVKWEKENGSYEANFIQNNHKMSALYDTHGYLKETEQEIKVEELPLPVVQYIQHHYVTAKKITTAAIIKAGTVVKYEVEINKTDLIFDAAGTFIKKETD